MQIGLRVNVWVALSTIWEVIPLIIKAALIGHLCSKYTCICLYLYSSVSDSKHLDL